MSKNRKPSAQSAIRNPHSAFDSIRLRGVRQNNLKGFDLDIPLGKYIAVTGLSGAGKSSLVFDTLHAEGQRRYVETFSAYTRQFLELLNKPRVDSIENIRPSIAIEQTNTVKTSRSTVGTMTELADYFKVWFSHVAQCHDPETGELVEADTPQTIWAKTLAAAPGQTLVITFRVKKPGNITWPEILANLKGQSYVRVLLPLPQNTNTRRTARPNPPDPSDQPDQSDQPDPHSAIRTLHSATTAFTTHRVDDLLAAPEKIPAATPAIHVVQDRLEITAANRARFLEAAEAALHFGHGQMQLFVARAASPCGSKKSGMGCQPMSGKSTFFILHSSFSSSLHNPTTNRSFRPATPALFSFNSPLGACPKCRGFGRVIEIDYRLAIPDQNLSIEQGAIKAFEGQVYSMSREDLIRAARRHKIPTNIPYARLTEKQRDFVLNGEPEYRARKARGEEIDYETDDLWYGLRGFFNWLENTTYKMHVRVFLSRYRAYNPCPDCRGQRLQPESLCWKWRGRTLPELYTLPVSDLLTLVETALPDRPDRPDQSDRSDQSAHSAHSALCIPHTALDNILTRLRYLAHVGLGYLTLDRSSKTLSGGEVERVNLTSCLGTSLVDTLFVLDEPSVGLHPRDIDRLIAIIRSLTDAGNTVIVVEHDEAMIRAADHIIEIGPEPGARGGRIVFSGPLQQLLAHPTAITGRYLSGRETIPVPPTRRPVALLQPDRSDQSDRSDLSDRSEQSAFLRIAGASKHNIHNLTLALPLNRLVCISGVSGSGKSTLLDNIIHQGLLASRHQLADDPATIASITGAGALGEIILVDQSPLSRTPRSNPALYTEAWEHIRELYAATPAAQTAGFTASSFSFNSGDGRCDHCNGLGSERVEMQFLSDVFVPCPICEGRRFKPEVLAITNNGLSISDLLNTTIDDALALHAAHPQITTRLAPLAQVGLGYLTLGQPLNTLSGGESQRLKLVRYLAESNTGFQPVDSEVARAASPCGSSGMGDSPMGLEVARAASPCGSSGMGDSPMLAAKPPVRVARAASPCGSSGTGDSPVQSPAPKNPSDQSDQPAPPAPPDQSPIRTPHSPIPNGALLLLDEPTTGLHRHDVKRLLAVLHALVERGHSVVVIEHNTDILKSADWLIEIGPDAGAAGGRIVAEGTPEHIATTNTATAPFLRAALHRTDRSDRSDQSDRPAHAAPVAHAAHSARSTHSARIPRLHIHGARENNLKNITLSIPHHALNVVTGVSGSGKSTLAFDIVFAEGQRRFMESMSAYARQFVEQLPRPDIDQLTGIPPAVAIEQRITRGTRKSTVASITEVAQYLRLLYARLGVQHHPDAGHPIEPLTPAQLRAHLAKILATDPRALKAKKLHLCAPLVRGRKGHHQPIATWIAKQGHTHMRADGRLLPVSQFQKLDRYKEHDIEVVLADLKSLPEKGRAVSPKPPPPRRAAVSSNTGVPSVGSSNMGVPPMPTARRAASPKPPSKNPALPANTAHTANTDATTETRKLKTENSQFQSLDEALKLGHGTCFLLTGDNKILAWLSTTRTDSETGETFPELDPKNFSFNSPRGWCPACRGHGRIYPWMLELDNHQHDTHENRDIAQQLRAYGIDEAADISDRGQPCPECRGDRLNRNARAVRLHFVARAASPCAANAAAQSAESAGSARSVRSVRSARSPRTTQTFSPSVLQPFSLSLPALLRLTPAALLAQLRQLDQADPRTRAITQDILPQIEERLRFLDHVGLGYLTLDRPTETLSGGESQRIRLAAQLGSNLSGVLYVLDEPSIGLHARDNDRLIETLKTLRAKGNTLLVVEHDDEIMRHADHIIDLGPAAGVHGGEILATGAPAEIKKNASSLTGLFLKTGIKHPLRGAYRPISPAGNCAG